MSISVAGEARDRFRQDLLAHRRVHALNDLEYATDILKISLNTYKKCIDVEGASISLSRNTFVRVCTSALLDPSDYGVDISLPHHGAIFGGYSKSEFEFIVGKFAVYRRS